MCIPPPESKVAWKRSVRNTRKEELKLFHNPYLPIVYYTSLRRRNAGTRNISPYISVISIRIACFFYLHLTCHTERKILVRVCTVHRVADIYQSTGNS